MLLQQAQVLIWAEPVPERVLNAGGLWSSSSQAMGPPVMQ